jgi:hypothetical protein
MLFSGDIGQGVSQAFTQLEKVAKAVNSGTFTVNQENVLAAARIIDAQADSLREKVRDIEDDLTVVAPGNDEVSLRTAQAWNDLLVQNDDSYRIRIMEYVAGLRRLAVQLGDTARSYGYSEDEISAAYGQPSA